MAEIFKSRITLKKFLKDCNKFKVDKQTFDVSYIEFLKYFKDTKTITKHNLVISINFTYGWMPSIFDFRSNKFSEDPTRKSTLRSHTHFRLLYQKIFHQKFPNHFLSGFVI